MSERPACMRLTEENVRRLQPSIIKPMPAVTIVSGDDGAEGDTGHAKQEPLGARLERLKAWVYYAMRTLDGMGTEGRSILNMDELFVAGPGDVRLRDVAFIQQNGKTPDLNDPAYWKAKLEYLEARCKPLSQARRKRRKLEHEKKAAAGDATQVDTEAAAARYVANAAAENGGSMVRHRRAPVEAISEPQGRLSRAPQDQQLTNETYESLEEAEEERRRIESSRLLWRSKQFWITNWIAQLPNPPPQLLPPVVSPDDGYAPGHTETRAGEAVVTCGEAALEAAPAQPASVNSSVMEISAEQFTKARRPREMMGQSETATQAPANVRGEGLGEGDAAIPDVITGSVRPSAPLSPHEEGAQHGNGQMRERQRLQPMKSEPQQMADGVPLDPSTGMTGTTEATAVTRATPLYTPSTSVSQAAGLAEDRRMRKPNEMAMQENPGADSSMLARATVLGKRARITSNSKDSCADNG